jgi:hypothetical protein
MRKKETVVFLAHYKNIKMRIAKHFVKHVHPESILSHQEALMSAIAHVVAQAILKSRHQMVVLNVLYAMLESITTVPPVHSPTSAKIVQ